MYSFFGSIYQNLYKLPQNKSKAVVNYYSTLRIVFGHIWRRMYSFFGSICQNLYKLPQNKSKAVVSKAVVSQAEIFDRILSQNLISQDLVIKSEFSRPGFRARKPGNSNLINMYSFFGSIWQNLYKIPQNKSKAVVNSPPNHFWSQMTPDVLIFWAYMTKRNKVLV